MEPTADHLDHYTHQTGQLDQMLPNGAAHNTMDPMMHHDGTHQMDDHHLHESHHMDSGTDGSGMMMMKMYFHYGLGDMVLFKGLVMDSNTTLMLTCLILFLAGVLLEFIDYSRGYLSCRCRAVANSLNAQYKSSSESRLVNGNPAQEQTWSCCAGSRGLSSNQQETEREQLEHSNQMRRRNLESSGAARHFEAKFFPVRSPDPHIYRLIQAGLQFIRTGISLTLMLVAMTYNICLIFPIVLGELLGASDHLESVY